jgi:hypothetical protein
MVTHGATPLVSTGDGADELIKDFGIASDYKAALDHPIVPSKPFTMMDRSEITTVDHKRGGAPDAELACPGRASTSFDDFPEIPEFLRRNKVAA